MPNCNRKRGGRWVAVVAAIMVWAWPGAMFAAQFSTGWIAAAGADAQYRTQYHVQDSEQPGPVVVVIGGVHGNEPAGAAAAEQIRHWPIIKGKLIVVPRANPAALAANQRRIPGLKGNDGDLNRHFPGDGEADMADGDIAPLLWDFIKAQQPDWLIDLHEGYDFHKTNSDSVGSSVIHFTNDRATPLAKAMVAVVNAEVTEEGRKFVRLARGGPINGSLARAAAHRLGAEAMILETTSKGQPLSWRVRQHRLMVHRLLSDIAVIPPEVTPHVMTPQFARADDPALHIAIYDAAGTGGNGVANLRRIIGTMEGAAAHVIGPADIHDGVLSQFDVVIFPGGSGSGEARAIGEAGRESVRQFVRDGGAYIGICAGAYLGTSGYDWSLNLINARTVDSKHWRRGAGTVVMELTDVGTQMLGEAGRFDVRYVNGPLFGPAGNEDLPPFDVLAYFRTELAENGAAAGVMIDTPAMIAAPYHRGRVALISCHPEQSLPWVIERVLQWAGGVATSNP